VIARGEIDVVTRVAARRGPHVAGVERVLEREDHAVHGHLREIGSAPVRRVERRRLLQRIGLLPEHLADCRRAPRQRTFGRMPVVIAAAGDRPLPADVECCERVQLPGIGDAGDHAELLLHARIGGRGLHAAVLEGRTLVAVEIGQDGGSLDGLRRKAHPAHRAHRPGRFGNGRPVFRNEHARHAVVGARPLQVLPDHGDAGRPTLADRLVQFGYRRLFDAERLAWPVDLIWHHLGPWYVGIMNGTPVIAYPPGYPLDPERRGT
jgi:hypothetical protein